MTVLVFRELPGETTVSEFRRQGAFAGSHKGCGGLAATLSRLIAKIVYVDGNGMN
jgi:hypothetical protein